MVTILETPSDQLLVTKTGKPKHRFNRDEKLALLDPTASPKATEARLLAFQKLFALRYSKGIMTKRNRGPRDWSAIWGKLTREHIANHLLADRIPTRPPRWVGARSFSSGSWLCIDVDPDRTPEQADQQWLEDTYDVSQMDDDEKRWLLYRRKFSRPKPQLPKLPLEERQRQVEQAFNRMGVDSRKRNEVLVQRSPSGGLHYYLFFDKRYPLYCYQDILQDAGLNHVPGQIEFFPSTTHSLRLPFGHIPDRPARPKAWVEFIDRYRKGRIRRHSLATLVENLDNNRSSWTPPTQATPSIKKPQYQSTRPTSQNSAHFLGNPRATGQKQHPSHHNSNNSTANPITSMAEAEELMQSGIQQRGTRNAILNLLAQHLIWFRHQSAAEATDILITWAMNPRHNSEEIEYDLAHGTDVVPKQIALMCRWYEKIKQTVPHHPGNSRSFTPLFSMNEISTLRQSLDQLSSDEKQQQAVFLLHFLWFAKQHGSPTPHNQAWEASPAIRSIIRRWPGCHHMHYKHRIDLAIAADILEIIKDKWHRPNGKGRARTYRLIVPPETLEDATLDYTTALTLLTNNDRLDTPVEEKSHDQKPDTQDKVGADHANHNRSNSRPGNPRRPTRIHPPALHQTSPRISLEPRPHQCNQKPDATPNLSNQSHGNRSPPPRRLRRHRTFVSEPDD